MDPQPLRGVPQFQDSPPGPHLAYPESAYTSLGDGGHIDEELELKQQHDVAANHHVVVIHASAGDGADDGVQDPRLDDLEAANRRRGLTRGRWRSLALEVVRRQREQESKLPPLLLQHAADPREARGWHNPGSAFRALPDAVLMEIFSYLQGLELFTCSHVSRRWYALSWRPELWLRQRFPQLVAWRRETPEYEEKLYIFSRAQSQRLALQAFSRPAPLGLRDPALGIREENLEIARITFQHYKHSLVRRKVVLRESRGLQRLGGPATWIGAMCFGRNFAFISLSLFLAGLLTVSIALGKGVQPGLLHFIPFLALLAQAWVAAMCIGTGAQQEYNNCILQTCPGLGYLFCGYWRLDITEDNFIRPIAGRLADGGPSRNVVWLVLSNLLCVGLLLWMLKLADTGVPDISWTGTMMLFVPALGALIHFWVWLMEWGLMECSLTLSIYSMVILPVVGTLLLAGLRLDEHITEWAYVPIPLWCGLVIYSIRACFDESRVVLLFVGCCAMLPVWLTGILFALSFSGDLVPSWAIPIPLYVGVAPLLVYTCFNCLGTMDSDNFGLLTGWCGLGSCCCLPVPSNEADLLQEFSSMQKAAFDIWLRSVRDEKRLAAQV